LVEGLVGDDVGLATSDQVANHEESCQDSDRLPDERHHARHSNPSVPLFFCGELRHQGVIGDQEHRVDRDDEDEYCEHRRQSDAEDRPERAIGGSRPEKDSLRSTVVTDSANHCEENQNGNDSPRLQKTGEVKMLDLVTGALMLAILVGLFQAPLRQLGTERRRLWGSVVLYTGFVYRGPSAAKDIKKELIQILKAEGLNNIKEAIGKGA